ncbi:MAG: hypothetical protein EU532_12305 [Promethearchaeota archaeon]|nr:MAG: hypothetical protein EU532_12305 [Candidatus Lokiarchaeota archaeon]
MGFSVKEITFKQKHLLYLTEPELAGPWFSFKLKGKRIGTIPVVLKNIEPTPIYQLVNSRKGTKIDRITLDFDIREYLKKLINEKKLKPLEFKDEKHLIRLYIDIFLRRGQAPYMNTYFTLKNDSDFNLIDFSMFFIFDFDINGLKGFDDDLSGYDEENDIIYQFDKTGVFGGFSTISKPTYFETKLTKDFEIGEKRLTLSNTLAQNEGEIVSALQIEFKTLEPEHSFQTALTISGGFSKEELFENINNGKRDAIKYLSQVYRSVRSEQRNKQEEAFIKLNLQKAEGCKD